MRKVVLTAFVIFGIAERVVAGDLSDRFKNDFDGTRAPALGIPSVVGPNLDVPAAAVAPKPRPRPRHDISPSVASPGARAPTARLAIGQHRTHYHVATGREGDRARALLASAGHNFHQLLHWFGELWQAPSHAGSE